MQQFSFLYLFEETQNTKSKTNVSLHCGTVSNSQTRWKQLQHPSIDGPRSAARVQRNTTRPWHRMQSCHLLQRGSAKRVLCWVKYVKKKEIQKTIPYDFTYMWNLKNKMNKWNRNRLIDTKNILTFARWKGGWRDGWKGQRDWEVQIGTLRIVMGM